MQDKDHHVVGIPVLVSKGELKYDQGQPLWRSAKCINDDFENPK